MGKMARPSLDGSLDRACCDKTPSPRPAATACLMASLLPSVARISGLSWYWRMLASVGLAPSANIGDDCAMFEAIHGSAPDIAGQGIANPSGLLLASVLMLNHIDQPDVAEKIHNAWLCSIEDGVHTTELAHSTGQNDRLAHKLSLMPLSNDSVTSRSSSNPSRIQRL